MSENGTQKKHSAPKQRPSAAGKTLLRLIWLAGGLLVGVVVVLYLMRGVFLEPLLKKVIARALVDASGPAVEIGDISGNYLTNIEIREVRTREAGTAGPLVAIDIDRLAAAYSLLQLRRGRDAFLRHLSVEIEGARVGLDISRPRKPGPAGAGITLPEALPKLSVRHSSVDLTGKGLAAAVAGLSITIEGNAPSRITISAQRADLAHPSLRLRPSPMEGSLEYTPERVTVKGLSANGTRIITDARLDLEALPASFSSAAELSLFGGSVVLTGASREEGFDLSLSAERVDLARASSLVSFGEHVPTGILTLNVTAASSPAAALGFEGDLSFSLEDGAFRGRSFAAVSGRGGVRDDALSVATLRGRTAASSLAFTNGRIPLATLQEKRWRDLLHEAEAAATLESTDLPAFLALWGLVAPAAGVGRLPSHKVSLAGSLEGGTLSLSSADLESAAGRLKSGQIDVIFPASGTSWAETGITGGVDVDVEDLAAFSSLLTLPALQGRVSGRVRLDGTAAAPEGIVEAEGRGLFIGERFLGDISLALAADRESILVNSAELRQGEENRIGLEAVKLPVTSLRGGGVRRIVTSLRGGAEADLRNVPQLLASFGAADTLRSREVPEHVLAIRGLLDEGRVHITDGSFSTPDGSIGLENAFLIIAGDGRDFLESRVEAALRVRLPDLGEAARVFALPSLEGSAEGAATVAGPLNGIGGTAEIKGRDLRLGGVFLGDASLKVAAAGGDVTVEELTFVNGPDILRASGIIDLPGARIDGGNIEFSVREISDYARGFAPDAWLPRGKIKADIVVSGPLGGIDGTADIALEGFAVGALSLGDASLRAAVSGDKVTVEEFNLVNRRDTLRASGSYDITTATIDGAAVELSAENISDYIMRYVPEDWLPRGKVEASVTASGPVNRPRVSAKLRLADGAVGAIPVEFAEALVSGDSVTYRIERLTAATGLGSLGLEGQSSVTIEESGAVSLASTRIDLPPGSVTVAGSYGPEGKVDFFVQGRGLTSRGWLERYAGDRVLFDGADISVGVTGTVSSPAIEAAVSVAALRGGADAPPLTASFQGAYGGGMLHLRTLGLQGAPGSIKGRGRIPLAAREEGQSVDLLLEMDLEEIASLAFLFPPGLVPRGSLQGEIRAGGTLSRPEFLVALEAGEVFLPEGLVGPPPGPLALRILMSGGGDLITLESLSLTSKDLSFNGSGTWSGPPALAKVLEKEGDLRTGFVSFTGSFSLPDLSWAAGPFDKVRHLGGSLSGEVAASGPVGRPVVDAALMLRNGEASLSGLPLLSSLDGTVTFRESRLALDGIQGLVGGAPAALKGHILFEDERHPVFDLELSGEGLLLYRGSGTRIRADSNLTAAGPLDALAVGGTVRIVDSGYTRDFDFLSAVSGEKKPAAPRDSFLFSFRNPPLRDMTFDLKVETAEPFSIRNQHIKGSLQPDLRLRGTGELPFLDGVVVLDPSRIVLPAGILRTEKGKILFSAEEPDRIGLEVTGATRIMGYDITVSISGFADDPRIVLTSVPPLPNDELLLLVLLGTPPASGDVRTSGVSGSSLAFFLGRGYLSRIFGSEDETLDTVLERFETAVGRDITETGRPTVESTLRLGEDVLREGDTLYLTGERDRFDDINYGVRLLFEFGGGKDDE